MMHRLLPLAFVLATLATAHAEPRAFPAGSLVIPMDLAYQDTGMFRAYGLLFQLLRDGIPVVWVIDPAKTWHAAPCDTPGDLCAWDCAIEGSGVKCPYPTASPDATITTTLGTHAYRGGPFVIDAAHAPRAQPIIAAWNTGAPATVAVHVATSAFSGFASRDLIAAPTIAVFADGNEDIATAYLRAAGIPQSNGMPFPAGRCTATGCGPGTSNPDLLDIPSLMGPMGTCAAPNFDHKNGALFRADGLPAYCQIMSMHWGVNDREKVECDGGCGATQAECGDRAITFHGHEVVAEVRAFLDYPVHLFAECQAVNAYENTTPNPAWPWLDDAGRDGHFLTTLAVPPPIPDPGAIDEGSGLLRAAQPDSVIHLNPHVPYNQLDGAFETVGGSEPAYTLGGMFKNDRQVSLLTGTSAGLQDVWMTGYVDGTCDIVIARDGATGGATTAHAEMCGKGKVSYLGGHAYGVTTPISANFDHQGARLFLNALFEADCVTEVGQPSFGFDLTPVEVLVPAFPADIDLVARYANLGLGAALDARFHARSDALMIDESWPIAAIGGQPARAGDPAASGSQPISMVRFPAPGDYEVTLGMDYRIGLSPIAGPTRTFTVRVALDEDGDGNPDDGAGANAGCCGTGSSPVGALSLAALVGVLARRRRRLT